MSEVVYSSEVRIERVKGPVRKAYLPAESEPVIFGVHGRLPGITKFLRLSQSRCIAITIAASPHPTVRPFSALTTDNKRAVST